jgi:protein involved in polysaccharide export with SLBB domain
VYSLNYVAGGAGPVNYIITVDSSYRVRVSNLGVINVAGKTYRQLKQDAETIVSNNYPLSGVQLTMIKPSNFSVYIKGEVNRATELTTWAMGRLSSLVNGSLSAYSSTRNITVTSTDGQVKTYDLFRAQRFGDLSQDPYLRPGDIITLSHLDRKVSVYGHVERPGSYELLSGENIRDLIVRYANGYTSRADTDRVELTRFVENNEAVGDTIYLTREEINANYSLQHADAVYVPPKMP